MCIYPVVVCYLAVLKLLMIIIFIANTEQVATVLAFFECLKLNDQQKNSWNMQMRFCILFCFNLTQYQTQLLM